MFFLSVKQLFFCKNAVDKPDGFLVHAMSVLGTSLLCSLYMLSLFLEQAYSVRCTCYACSPESAALSAASS
jgi:hypothetical protein